MNSLLYFDTPGLLGLKGQKLLAQGRSATKETLSERSGERTRWVVRCKGMSAL